MPAGLGQGYREDWDTTVGNLCDTLNKTLLELIQLNGIAAALGATGLEGLPSRASNQYSSADATALLNGLGDANKIAQIYLGAAFLTGGNAANGATYTVATNSGNGTFGYSFQSLNIGKLFGLGQ